MEELIRRVSEKAGISEEQARSAVQAVADFAKERVPPQYSGYIDTYLGAGTGGESTGGGGLGGLAGGLGKMFGNKE